VYVEGFGQSDLRVREPARQALRAIRNDLKARTDLPVEIMKELGFLAKTATPEEYLRFGLKEKGDPVSGQKLFQSTCIQFHTVGTNGGKVGPDLTTAGAQFPRRELAESILFPSKALREGYQAMNVETKDGDLISGLLKGETADELTLVDAAAQLQRIPKSQIASRKLSELSLMPEGLHAAMTTAEFADLLAYLETLR
jgi:putative heme-binding domain-containing protein